MAKRPEKDVSARVEALAALLHELTVEERALVRTLARLREVKAVAIAVIARAARKAR